MAEITGGELNYAVTVDVDQLKKGMSDAEGKLMGFSAVAEKAGEKLDTALKGTATESLKELANEATKTGSTLKSVGDVKIDFGLTKENLAIQKQVIAEITKNIEEIEKRAKDMAPGMAQASVLGELKPLKEELAAEEKALSSLEIEIKKTAVSTTTLSTKYLEAKNRLAELTLANKQGTPEYTKAEAEVRKYGTALSDTNARAKALTAGTIGGFAQGLSLITGTMATGTALLGAFGGKSEDLNQIMLKTQALLAATVTLQEIKNTAMQKGGVISGIMAIQETARSRATTLATINTVRATIAQKALNLVANANPYILLATAILTVVGALALYSAASSESAKRTKLITDLNKQMADSVAEPIISFKKLQIQWNALGNDFKAKEKFVKDNKERFQELGVSVNNVNDAENLLIKNSVNFQAALMMRARAAAAASIAADKYKEALSAQLQDEQEKRTLKGGRYIEQQNTRLKREARDLVGATLAEISKQGFSDANYATRLNVGYDKSDKDFLKKGNITEFVKPEKVKKEKVTKEKKADEYFPPGSVAEIQKRIAAIDEALSKATNSGAIEALKNKRIAITEELAEALKRIEIKSLEDRANEQEKYNVAYGIIAEKYGKEAADKMYGDLIKGSGSYLSYLEQERKALEEKQGKGLLTTQEKEDLDFAITKLDEYANIKSKQDTWKNDLTDSLRGVVLISDQIDIVEKKKAEIFAKEGNSIPFLNFSKDADNQIEGFIGQQKEMYQSFLNEHQNYEEQKTAITDKYNELRSQTKTPEEKKKIDKAEKSETSQLELGFLKESDDWKMAFGDVELFTQNTIKRILANLIKYREEKKDALQPTEERELAEAISRLQVAANRNPFIKIIEGLKSMKTARIAVINAEKEYQAILAANGGNLKSDEAVAAYKKLTKAEQEAADKKKAFISGVQETQSVFNAVGEGVLELGDAFGGMSDATKDAIGDIMAIGNAAMDFATSLASGDVAGMIKAGVKIITSVFNALSGDKKKEREIKLTAAQVKILETAYNDLAFAAERAFGSQKYDGQRDLIKNLQEQKIAIESMMRLEQEKKKGDKDKIEGYQSQIQTINQSIEQLKEGIIKDVLQTDIVDAAAKLGDALVANFGRGEDAMRSLETAANDVLKNLLKNQLNLMLQNKMKPILDKLLRDAGFNADGTGSFIGLTPEQIAEFKEKYIAAGQSMQGFLEAFPDIFGDVEENAQGLKGDIKGITEKTAGALEAQVNALRIYIAEGLNIQRSNQAIFVSCLQNLILIEANTRNLIQIRQDISDMNGKMSKGLAGL